METHLLVSGHSLNQVIFIVVITRVALVLPLYQTQIWSLQAKHVGVKHAQWRQYSLISHVDIVLDDVLAREFDLYMLFLHSYEVLQVRLSNALLSFPDGYFIR